MCDSSLVQSLPRAASLQITEQYSTLHQHIPGTHSHTYTHTHTEDLSSCIPGMFQSRTTDSSKQSILKSASDRPGLPEIRQLDESVPSNDSGTGQLSQPLEPQNLLVPCRTCVQRQCKETFYSTTQVSHHWGLASQL